MAMADSTGSDLSTWVSTYFSEQDRTRIARDIQQDVEYARREQQIAEHESQRQQESAARLRARYEESRGRAARDSGVSAPPPQEDRHTAAHQDLIRQLAAYSYPTRPVDQPTHWSTPVENHTYTWHAMGNTVSIDPASEDLQEPAFIERDQIPELEAGQCPHCRKWIEACMEYVMNEAYLCRCDVGGMRPNADPALDKKKRRGLIPQMVANARESMEERIGNVLFDDSVPIQQPPREATTREQVERMYTLTANPFLEDSSAWYLTDNTVRSTFPPQSA